MIPDWESIKEALPFLITVGAAWVRFELALSGVKDKSASNGAEIAKLETKLETKVEVQDKVSQVLALQLAELKATSVATKEQLNRMENKLDAMRRDK